MTFAERPRIAVTDSLTGALLALTDTIGLRRAVAEGLGLGPPAGTTWSARRAVRTGGVATGDGRAARAKT